MMHNSSLSDEQRSDAISFGCYPYVYYSNIVNHRSIALPHNLSDLNDIFCVPLNRHGLYRDCSEGFGPSLINIGSLMKTAQRTGMGGCCTSYCNLFLQLSFIFSHFESVSYLHQWTTLSRSTHWWQLLSNYNSPEFQWQIKLDAKVCSRSFSRGMDSGTWTSFAISFHHSVLAKASKTLMYLPSSIYVSAFYSLLLIALKYACVELHGHNFRPIVWLWKPFHRCCVNVRRRWKEVKSTFHLPSQLSSS